jgi:glycosyltransferase involved in cell wall biosynthesis
MKKYNILYILNDSHPLKYFLHNHILYLNSLGDFNISVILNNSNNESFEYLNIKVYSIKINRSPNVIDDFKALTYISIHLLKNRYDIVHSVTPKSGLLSAIAAFITFKKNRVHTFTGQVWSNYTGLKRFLFKSIDKLIIKLNTHILTDSYSQKKYLIDNKIGSYSQIHVLNKGSICGVDLNKFKKDINRSSSLKNHLNIKSGEFVILFVGRLNYDKGIVDLFRAFLKFQRNNLHLIVLGRDESNIIEQLSNNYPNITDYNIHFINEVSNPEDYMSVADILCLPSYREGFGNVVIEAGALGVPSIVSNIYGLNDSIINNKTGLFFEVGNIDDLYKKLYFLYSNNDILNEMKKNCMAYVFENFDSKIITQYLYEFYNRILNNEQ